MKLGLFGGSFDPVHLGHLLAASEAARLLDLDKVIFVTSARPPHKKPLAAAESRYEMVGLATGADPRFLASRVELDLPGPSYTVRTLEIFRAQYPEEQMFFITGADAFRDITIWNQPEALFSNATVAAVTRPGYPLSRIDVFFRSRILPLEIPGYEISSTMVRERAATGASLAYLVPHNVEVYIAKHRLYRPD